MTGMRFWGFLYGKRFDSNCLSPSERGGPGRGHVRVEQQAVEGKGPPLQVEACSNYMRVKRPRGRARKGSHGMAYYVSGDFLLSLTLIVLMWRIG